jgi:hypothetical protein
MNALLDHESPLPEVHESPPESISALDLLESPLSPMPWVIDGVLPVGASILCGGPASGKTQLALNVALAVALGTDSLGHVAQAGNVLFLALNDGRRRLQGRMKKLVAAIGQPEGSRLQFITTTPDRRKRGFHEIAMLLSQHRPRLIVIDDITRVYDNRRHANNWFEDFDGIGLLGELAHEHGAAILILAHTPPGRGSAEAVSVLKEVSGCNSIYAVAEAVLDLKRREFQPEATLRIDGPDICTKFYLLRWDADSGQCKVGGESEEPPLHGEQRRIVAALESSKRPLTIMPLMQTVDTQRNYDAFAKLLRRMVKAGMIGKDGHGRFVANRRAKA